MRSLLDGNELPNKISGIEFPIANVTVTVQEELQTPSSFPVIAVREVLNEVGDPVTTASGKLKLGPSTLGYQFAVFCRDCKTVDGEILTRGDACRLLAMTLYDWLFENYNMTLEAFGPVEVYDKTCNVLFFIAQCVLDEHNYTYSR